MSKKPKVCLGQAGKASWKRQGVSWGLRMTGVERDWCLLGDWIKDRVRHGERCQSNAGPRDFLCYLLVTGTGLKI